MNNIDVHGTAERDGICESALLEVSGASLKASYENLRRQMEAEKLPFLNAEELECEIADRRGNRS